MAVAKVFAKLLSLSNSDSIEGLKFSNKIGRQFRAQKNAYHSA